jgi:hypothetical protein
MTHHEVLEWAACVERATRTGKLLAPGERRRTPPASAYRRSAKGRKAWLDQAQVGLSRERLDRLSK